jgi:outer membrane protein assembly factor BamB
MTGRVAVYLAVIVALIAASALTTRPVTATTAAPIPNGSWPVYHHDDAHSGSDPSQPTAISATAGWVSATLDEQVYAEPLVWNGLIYAATLNNTVYAIDQATGVTNWSTNVGATTTSGWVCGNVSPMGILGTPVIDTSAGRIYVAALLSDHLYWVFGLDLNNGTIVFRKSIPANIGTGFDWKIQQERGALALANGYVYVPFGGRAGDCFDSSPGHTNDIPYWGWVVGVPTDGVSQLKVYETPSGAESVWAAGGVVVDDSSHNVFFATGNAIPCAGSTYSDAIVRTNPTLGSPTFFEPQDWQGNWCGPDSDLGSASPILISPNLMFTAGKHGGGFLLDPTNLGGVNGQVFPPRSPYNQAEVCLGTHGDATFGSFAYSAPYVYLACQGHGMVALRVDTSARTFSSCDATCAAPSWQSGGSETFGPPIVVGGVVWAISTDGSGLWGFDAATGARVFQSAAFGTNRFVTPSEAGGRLLVPAGDQIRSYVMQFGNAELLGGVLTSGPDAASWSANRLDVFVRGTDNALYHRGWPGTTWGGWESLGGVLTSAPGAVSWGPNRIDVFVRGTDNQLYQRAWSGSAWGSWAALGGGLIGGPDVASWGSNRLDVFVRGTDNALYHKAWDGTTWNPWELLGGGLTSDPSAVSWGPNRIDVFVRGGDNGLWRRSWTGSGWAPWESLGGSLGSGPDASSCSSGHLDVLMIGADHGLWRKGWNGSQWGAWEALGGNWTADPSAVCQAGATSGDAFLRGVSLGLWHTTFTAS